MGGGQSTVKDSTQVKDIVKFFEAELKNWNDIIKNLKQTWKTSDDRSWVPKYLHQQMEETEIKWTNIKSLIQPQHGHTGTPQGSCSIELHKQMEDDNKQLRKNNETLLQNKQENESTIQKQQKKIKEFENDQRKDNIAPQTSAEGDRSISQSEKPTINQRQQQTADSQDSEKDEITATLRKQIAELEQNVIEQKTEVKKVNDSLEAKNEKIKQLEKQIDDLKKQHEEFQKKPDSAKYSTEKPEATFDEAQGELQNERYTEIEKLRKKYSDMEADFKRQKLEFMEEQQILRAQKETLESHASSLQKEKETLLLRLSKIAGDKLVNNNPAITDLSDPDRPTKLGEIYSEIYDNEWTDAVEALKEAGHDEDTAIETLRLTLENVMQFCESKAELLIKKASDAVNLLFEEFRMSVAEKKMPSHLTMPRKQAQEIGQLLREKSSMEDIKLQLRWKTITKNTDGVKVTQTPEKTETAETPNVDSKLKQFRKEMATSMVPIVQKAYIEASWTNDCILGLKPYIMKCLYLGWMMVVQSPPMVLHKCPSGKEIKFDKNVHKEYTASGPLVSYIVWPALLLNENGSVVCKGVAQGKKSNTEDTK